MNEYTAMATVTSWAVGFILGILTSLLVYGAMS